MANWRLAFEDLFAYASQAGMEAAYFPGLFEDPSGGVNHMSFGATSGPGGIPGALATNKATFELLDLSRHVTGELDKPIFGLAGSEFRVRCLVDNALDFCRISGNYIDEATVGNTDLSKPFFMVGSGKAVVGTAYGDLFVQVYPGGAYPGSIIQTVLAGGLPTNVVAEIDVKFRLASDATGYLTVEVNGTQVYSYTGPIYDPAYPLSLSYVEVQPGGRVGNFRVYDTVTLSAPPSAPPTKPTACTSVPPSTVLTSPARSAGNSQGGQGWVRNYVGESGAVPVAADPVEGETLTGKSAVHLWAEIVHTEYPAGTQETLRYSHSDLDD